MTEELNSFSLLIYMVLAQLLSKRREQGKKFILFILSLRETNLRPLLKLLPDKILKHFIQLKI